MRRVQSWLSLWISFTLIASLVPPPRIAGYAQSGAGPSGRIAFIQSGNIWVIYADGSALGALTTGGNYLEASWSPDGDRIAFVRKGLDGEGKATWEIGVLDVSMLTETVVVPPQKTGYLLIGNYYQYYSLGWSPNGQVVYYIAYDGVTVWNFQAHTVNVTTLARDVGFTSFQTRGIDVSLADGRIVFIDWSNAPPAVGYNLNMANSNGTGRYQLFPILAETSINGVEWQRDGSRIVFSARDGSYGAGAVVFVSPTGAIQKALPAPGASDVTLSPGGEYAAYSADGMIRLMDTASGGITALTPGSMPDFSPQSPSISGAVTDPAHGPVANVLLTLSGGRTARTDANGRYKLYDIPPGAYTLIPQKNGYTFNPPSAAFTLAQVDLTLNFQAVPGPLVNRLWLMVNQAKLKMDGCYAEGEKSAQDGDFFAEQQQQDELALAAEFALGAVDTLALAVPDVDTYKNLTKQQMPGLGKAWRWIDDLRERSGVVAHAIPGSLNAEIQAAEVRRAANTVLKGGWYFFAAEFGDALLEEYLTDATVERFIKDSFSASHALESRYLPSLYALRAETRADLDWAVREVIDGLPAMSPEEEQAYVNDLTQRELAHLTQVRALEQKGRPLHLARFDREYQQDQWLAQFIFKFLARNLMTYLLDGGGAIVTSLAFTAYDILSAYNRLEQDVQMANLGANGVAGAEQCLTGVYTNTLGGLGYILDGAPVEVPGAANVTIHNVSVQESILFGTVMLWERESYTDIALRNPTAFPTTYTAFSFYGVTGFLGMSYQSMVEEEGTKHNLLSQQDGAIRVYYRTDKGGVSPDAGQPVEIRVLGATDTGKYEVFHTQTTWSPTAIGTDGRIITQASAADDAVLPYPIQQGFLYLPKTKDILGWVRVENGLEEAITASIQQALPAGVAVTDAGLGVYQGGGMSWSITVNPHQITTLYYQLQAFGQVGQSIPIPPAQLQISDLAGTKSADFTGSAETIQARLPLAVAADPPWRGVPGRPVEVPFTVANRGSSAQNGTLRLVLMDRDGVVRASTQRALSLAAGAVTQATLAVPAPLPEKLYLLKAFITTADGEEEVFGSYLNVYFDRVYLPSIQK